VVLLNTSGIETIVRDWSRMLGSVMHELSGWPNMAEQELDDESCRRLGFPEEFFTLCAEAGVSGSVTMLEVKDTVFRGVIGWHAVGMFTPAAWRRNWQRPFSRTSRSHLSGKLGSCPPWRDAMRSSPI
jgi:hypothetical protein